MRTRIVTVLLGITLAIIMIFGLLPACGGGTTGPAPTSGTSTGVAAPVAQGQVYHWRYQSNANAGTATYWVEEEFVKDMETASNGRLVLELAPQGAIVGSMEIFDAVATGAIETGSSCD